MLKSGGKVLITLNNFLGFDKSSDLLKIVIVFIGKIIIGIVKNNWCLFVKTTYKHLLKTKRKMGATSELANYS